MEETETYQVDNVEGGITSVKAITQELWGALLDPTSDDHKNMLGKGINPLELPHDLTQILSMKKSAAGFDASIVDMVVTFASGSVAKDLWTYIILPHLRNKFGDTALKKRAKKEKSSKKS